jgi:hypothetical protein
MGQAKACWSILALLAKKCESTPEHPGSPASAPFAITTFYNFKLNLDLNSKNKQKQNLLEVILIYGGRIRLTSTTLSGATRHSPGSSRLESWILHFI